MATKAAASLSGLTRCRCRGAFSAASNWELFPGSSASGVGCDVGRGEANKSCTMGQVAPMANEVQAHRVTMADRVNTLRSPLRLELNRNTCLPSPGHQHYSWDATSSALGLRGSPQVESHSAYRGTSWRGSGILSVWSMWAGH